MSQILHELFVVYLKFKFNWTSCILSGNIMRRASTQRVACCWVWSSSGWEGHPWRRWEVAWAGESELEQRKTALAREMGQQRRREVLRKSRCLQGDASSKGSRGESFQRQMACGCRSPISASVLVWPSLLLPVCLSSLCVFFIKTPAIGFKFHPDNPRWSHLEIFFFFF